MTEQVDIIKQLEEVESSALAALNAVSDEAGLEAWRVANLGKSSDVMLAFSKLPQYPKELRPQIGQAANRAKQALEGAFAQQSQVIKEAALQRALTAEKLDVTMPGRRPMYGRMHPVSRVMRDLIRIFGDMGFQVYQSPEVETDEYNFGLLNIPEHHPARDMWDTYHTTQPGVILRTHTSPGQVRFMRQMAPEPIRVIVPGMVYRYEQTNASHESQFNQLEGLAIGRHITFSDLKGTLVDFAQRLYGEGIRTRIRPSYFPFTEPSAELDIECVLCGGKGCGVCKESGWLEIAGSGMVHPIVLQNGGYDPNVFSGFAFGMGPERVAMLKYRIGDIRYFWGNDVRFLEQF